MLANNRLAEARRALARPRKDARPRPVPQRHGEPSVFEHVIYIIKENRTYDQVFGDMKEGNGDPELCIFGEEVTPNHHTPGPRVHAVRQLLLQRRAQRRRHQWVDEAYVTDYLERSFGGFTRSYPYDGNDALAFAPSGFLWDNALARGEDIPQVRRVRQGYVRWRDRARTARPTFLDCTRLLEKSGKIEIRGEATIRDAGAAPLPHGYRLPLDRSRRVPGRAVLAGVAGVREEGDLPNLVIMSLPCNHTSGTKPGCRRPRRPWPTTTWPWAGSSRR